MKSYKEKKTKTRKKFKWPKKVSNFKYSDFFENSRKFPKNKETLESKKLGWPKTVQESSVSSRASKTLLRHPS